MKRLSLRSIILTALSIMFFAGLVLFVVFYSLNATDWAMYSGNTHIYTNGEFTGGGKITDSAGTILCETKKDKRVFSSDATIRKATLHAVGDAGGFISTGANNAFRKQLSGYNFITGLFSISEKYNNIELTINADVQAEAYNALSGYKGTVGVYNYKTGDLICMVSTPTYDVDSEYETKRAKDGEIEGVFINRFLSSTYAPGSTFKIVTAAASIDTFDDAYEREYTCKGGCEIEGETVKCTGYHGKISLKKAFAVSCNSYFSQLSVDLGKSKLTKYAEKFGFNKSTDLNDIEAKTGSYDVTEARTIELGWSGIGQYKDMQNPLSYLTSVGGVANDGVPIKPHIIKRITNSSGLTIKKASAKSLKRMLSRDTAKKVAELMNGAVEITYKKSYFEGLDVCGKTGTAEVDGKIPHSEFIGFCKDKDYPFAFIVVVEEGGSGNDIAKYIANRTLQAAKRAYK